MRLATILVEGREQAAVGVEERWVPLHYVDTALAGDLLALVRMGWSRHRLDEMAEVVADVAERPTVAAAYADYRPPYRHPRLIWGIGLNCAEHAPDLRESQPDDPASFVKGDHTIIGHGDRIKLPALSRRVTAEAEVALILGRDARSAAEHGALDVVFGICPVLDQTAEDILEVNPRYLTRAKNFETFLAFGPEVVTLDSLDADLAAVNVTTIVNGRPIRSNRVGNMLHSPQRLIAFHTAHMPMFAGDIISTGTPSAAVITDGDTVEARVHGLRPLVVTVAS